MKAASSLLTVIMLWLAGTSMVAAGWTDFLDMISGSDPAPQAITAPLGTTPVEPGSILNQAAGSRAQ